MMHSRVRTRRATSQEELIDDLNPVITGWGITTEQ